ncbi:MAG: hypothetical protein ACRDCE_20070 [Cetobacterium sp.]|uniref:hypothetical protein n=1 Tax=Cetobacterium sp. TaxID=2071632 RepID=UPI003EE5AC81
MRNKIIIKIIAFTMSIVLSLLFLSRIYNKKELKKFNNIPNKIKIANLGSSHGQFSFLYEGELEKEAFNFGLPAQPLYYDYKFLERYRDKFEVNSVLIIPISIFSFYQGNELIKYNERYSKILKYKDIQNIEFIEYFLSRYFSILLGENRFYNLINIKLKKNDIKELSNLEKIEFAKNTFKNHMAYNENSYLDIQNLKEILKICIKNNIKPILVTTPVSHALNELVTEEIYNQRIKIHINQVLDELDIHVEYLDYSRDKRFSKNLNYFIDADHLNKNGARKFTNIFLDDINYKREKK